MWYSFLKFAARILFYVAFRIRVFGRENVPSTGPVILAANHQSFMDPPLVGVGLNRQIHYMARKSLFEGFPPFTWLIRSLNAFPVARDRGDVGAVRETLRRLKSGAAIVVFPEATRTRTGKIGGFKPGVFMIAARAGVPVVPTIIEGAFESWPRTRLLPLPSRIKVAFGVPITVDRFNGDMGEFAGAVRGALVELQARMRTPAYGPPAESEGNDACGLR